MNYFKFKKKKRNRIKFLYDSDLTKYLKSMDIYDDIINRKIKCKFCKKVVTLENLQVLMPSGNSIEIICSDIKCLKMLK